MRDRGLPTLSNGTTPTSQHLLGMSGQLDGPRRKAAECSDKPQGLGAFGGTEEIMMLTSDVALLNDPVYLDIVNEFAGDSAALDEAFAAAWHKLTTSAFGNWYSCTGAAPYVAPDPIEAADETGDPAPSNTASGLFTSSMVGFLFAGSVLALN